VTTDQSTTGRTAVVTGGASGIGLAIAERLAAENDAVAIFDRDGAAAETAAAKIVASGGAAVGVEVDVTDRAQIDAGVATVRAGLAHVIEGHRIFTQLSVTDNLFLAAYDLPRGERSARVEEALGLFPEIAAKRHDRGGALSGGQQQMLAVAQGLVRRPRLLMLDEPSAGLSPVLVDRVLSVAARLRETGAAVLLVEQLVEKALALADRVYALAGGRVVLVASASEPDLPRRLERAYFGHDVLTA